MFATKYLLLENCCIQNFQNHQGENNMKENNSKTKISATDLIFVDAENLSLYDSFMQHVPRNENEEAVKELISTAIQKGVKNFWKPKEK